MNERDVSLYLETNFPYWKNGSCTYVVPRCYTYKWPHIQEIEVQLRPRSDDPKGLKGIFGNVKGSFAEHEVLNAFIYLCENKAQPAFIFHNFKWLNENNTAKQETDIIIVHRDLGIILVEIKSRPYGKVKDQLNNTEKIFKALFKEVFENETTSYNLFNVIKKVIVFPYKNMNTDNSSLTSPNGTTGHYSLGKSDLETFEYFDLWWWDNMVGNTNSDDCRKIYEKLIPELFERFFAKNNLKSSYNNLVIAETVHQLKTQSFLKDRLTDKMCNRSQLTCMMPNRKKIKCIDRHDVPVNVTDGKILQKVWDYITLEQCKVWNGNKQVICGPYGSGKTVLIQCKAATLACCGQHVLVIVPHHLIENYWNFFEEVVEPKCNKNEFIKLISIKDFYKSFPKYEKLAKSRHVFVDELLYPTSGNPFADFVFLDVLSCLLQERNYYVWIASHAYSVTENMLFNKDFESAICLPFQFKQKLSKYFVFLHITMRTTKEIHDYKNQLEFNDFNREFKSEDKDKAANDEFFQLLYINNVLGHSISGLPVETILYSKHYCLKRKSRHKIKRKNKSYKAYRHVYKIKKESFLFFSAKQIIKKVRYLKRVVPDIKYQNIAIIMDFYEKFHSLTSESSPVYLNHDPLGELKAHLQMLNFNGGNAVTMCYSNEIASLEWPIVFHIQCTDLCTNAKDKDKISFIQSDHGLIISRCMAYFIHICCSRPDSLTNKSFGEKFNAWYLKQQNHKKCLGEAINEYCRLEKTI